jgi:hypothetical protein
MARHAGKCWIARLDPLFESDFSRRNQDILRFHARGVYRDVRCDLRPPLRLGGGCLADCQSARGGYMAEENKMLEGGEIQSRSLWS